MKGAETGLPEETVVCVCVWFERAVSCDVILCVGVTDNRISNEEVPW